MGKSLYYCSLECPYKNCEYAFDMKTNNCEGREYNAKKRYIIRHIEKKHNKTRQEAIKLVNNNDAEKKASMIDMGREAVKKELFSLLNMDVTSKKFDGKTFINKLSNDTKNSLTKHFETTK